MSSGCTRIEEPLTEEWGELFSAEVDLLENGGSALSGGAKEPVLRVEPGGGVRQITDGAEEKNQTPEPALKKGHRGDGWKEFLVQHLLRLRERGLPITADPIATDFTKKRQSFDNEDEKHGEEKRMSWSCYKTPGSEGSKRKKSRDVPLYRRPTEKLKKHAQLISMIRLELRLGLSGNQTVANDEILPLVQSLRDQLVAQQHRIDELTDEKASLSEDEATLKKMIQHAKHRVDFQQHKLARMEAENKAQEARNQELEAENREKIMKLQAKVAGLTGANECLRKEIKTSDEWLATPPDSSTTPPKKKMGRSPSLNMWRTSTPNRQYLPLQPSPLKFLAKASAIECSRLASRKLSRSARKKLCSPARRFSFTRSPEESAQRCLSVLVFRLSRTANFASESLAVQDDSQRTLQVNP